MKSEPEEHVKPEPRDESPAKVKKEIKEEEEAMSDDDVPLVRLFYWMKKNLKKTNTAKY